MHEGIRGIPLDPSDKSDALVPVSGTSLAVGIDFHAGKVLDDGFPQFSEKKQSLLFFKLRNHHFILFLIHRQ